MPTAPDTSRCRGGHVPADPSQHPRWGQVPSASATVIGALGIGAVLVIVWLWLPRGLFWGLVGLVVVGFAFSAVAAALLGHRGVCWAQRTVRWWLGPVGALMDPIDVG